MDTGHLAKDCLEGIAGTKHVSNGRPNASRALWQGIWHPAFKDGSVFHRRGDEVSRLQMARVRLETWSFG